MCNCNDEPKCININMGCVTPIVANADAYYTKSEIDEKLEDIVTSGCCITPQEVDDKISSAITGYATEQWVEDKHYITGVDLSNYATEDYVSGYTYDKQTIDEKVASGGTFDPTQYYNKTQTNALLDDKLDVSAYTPTDLSNYYTKSEVDEKIPSLSGYATEQWVEDKHYITGVDLSNYATKAEIPTNISAFNNDVPYLTEHQSLSGYVTNTEFIQYIENLQNQITTLQEIISGCCSSSGSGYTRWITMVGENDYVCSGTTKYTKEKEQVSTDGIDWIDTSNYRQGETILETDSVDCGYISQLKFRGVLRNSNTVELPCDSSTTLTEAEVHNSRGYNSIEIGNCVTEIGDECFRNEIYISAVTIPSGVTTIGVEAFADAGNSSSVSSFTITLNEGLITIGQSAFFGYENYSALTIPNSVQTIGNLAFAFNNASELTIGSGVTSIGRQAFGKNSGHTQYSSVTILATVPPTLGEFNFDGEYPIYVPSESVDTYKAAEGWSTYADRIQPIT